MDQEINLGTFSALEEVAPPPTPPPSRWHIFCFKWKLKAQAFYAAVVFFINRWYIHYRVRVDFAAKCPACGHRKPHKVVFSASLSVLIHQCAQCQAAWAESPVARAEIWKLKPVEEELADAEEKQEQKTVARIQVAQREPIYLPSKRA